jgi:alpha-tubulin suppressor-like RCC1 family protein
VSDWGENHRGALGLGDTIERTEPVKVAGLEGVTKLAIGGQPSLPTHMLALLSDGTVKVWGAGAAGQLGQGIPQAGIKRLPDSLVPMAVPGLSDVIDIFAGHLGSFALQSDGTLLGWGENVNYQLASPTLNELVVSPRVLLRDVSALSVGFHYCVGVSGGFVYTWGKGSEGTIGDGTLVDKATPTLVAGLEDVLAIDAGETHVAVLLRGPMASEAPVTLTPGSGSLSLAWQSPATTSKWFVGYRKAPLNLRKEPVEWTRVSVDQGSRSYTFSGLTPGLTYEVFVSNPTWGRRVLEGVPNQ